MENMQSSKSNKCSKKQYSRNVPAETRFAISNFIVSRRCCKDVSSSTSLLVGFLASTCVVEDMSYTETEYTNVGAANRILKGYSKYHNSSPPAY